MKGVESIGDASRAALDALRPTPFGDMPFLMPVQLVNVAAEGFCDESATFLAGLN